MRQTYTLALPVYVPTLLLSVGQGVLIPTLPLYAKSYGVSNTLVALAVAIFGLGTLAGDVPAGTLLERYGRKPIMVVGRRVSTIPGTAVSSSSSGCSVVSRSVRQRASGRRGRLAA